MAKKINTNEDLESSVVTESAEPTFNYAEALTKFKTKSGVIRGLNAEGKDCKTIYGLLKNSGVTNNKGDQPIRYQHVRNVLVTPIKKA